MPCAGWICAFRLAKTGRGREIGIPLAIGALEGEVLLQFLVEAVVLS